jgi:hypothetical protein
MSASDEKNKRPLIDEIKSFRSKKLKTALTLLAIGLAGLVLPIIPGVLFIVVAVWLVFPDQSEKLWERVKEALAKNK